MAVDRETSARSKADRDAKPEKPGLARKGLDRRTIVVCVVIALAAAVISAVVVDAIAGHSSSPSSQGGLTAAKVVPDNISFTRFDGTKSTLADYAGQKLVVNFFSSTCVPCRTEMPAIEKVQEQAGEAITMIGIAVEDNTKAAEALVRQTGAKYDIGQDFNGELFAHVGGTVLPYTIFVAADGTIMERHSGALTASQLRQKISNNLLAGG